MNMFPFSGKPRFRSTLVKMIEGDEHSAAARMAEFIASSPQKYPHCHNYSQVGFNSNTYAQWVLNHFPDSGMRLPWNAFGKSRAPKNA